MTDRPTRQPIELDSPSKIKSALQAINDGYRCRSEYISDGIAFLVVENPDFKEDDGSNPSICICVDSLLALIDQMREAA